MSASAALVFEWLKSNEANPVKDFCCSGRSVKD
jgi:hypothetical protein